MPRGVKGSGPNGVKTVPQYTVLTESQKSSLLGAANLIHSILGGSGIAVNAFTAPVAAPIKRRRRRNVQPTQPMAQ